MRVASNSEYLNNMPELYDGADFVGANFEIAAIKVDILKK